MDRVSAQWRQSSYLLRSGPIISQVGIRVKILLFVPRLRAHGRKETLHRRLRRQTVRDKDGGGSSRRGAEVE